VFGSSFGRRGATRQTSGGGADPLAWRTANRLWLFDPDDTARTTLDGSNRVSNLAEAGGDATRAFSQVNAVDRPPVATVRGRRVLDFDSADAFLAGTTTLADDLQNLYAPQTLAFVWIAPPVLFDGFMPLLGAEGPSDAWYFAGMNSMADGTLQLVKTTETGVDYTTYGYTGTLTANQRVFFSLVQDGAGRVHVYRDGVEASEGHFYVGPPVPSGTTTEYTTHTIGRHLGWTIYGRGKFGAYMRFGVALSASDNAALAATAAARYP
jgi:hypothetical protein